MQKTFPNGGANKGIYYLKMLQRLSTENRTHVTDLPQESVSIFLCLGLQKESERNWSRRPITLLCPINFRSSPKERL